MSINTGENKPRSLWDLIDLRQDTQYKPTSLQSLKAGFLVPPTALYLRMDQGLANQAKCLVVSCPCKSKIQNHSA